MLATWLLHKEVNLSVSKVAIFCRDRTGYYLANLQNNKCHTENVFM